MDHLIDVKTKTADVFSQAGANAGVVTAKVLEQNDVVASIIRHAKEHRVALIIMGVSHSLAPHEWLGTQVKQQVDIPVVVLPYGESSL